MIAKARQTLLVACNQMYALIFAIPIDKKTVQYDFYIVLLHEGTSVGRRHDHHQPSHHPEETSAVASIENGIEKPLLFIY